MKVCWWNPAGASSKEVPDEELQETLDRLRAEGCVTWQQKGDPEIPLRSSDTNSP